jgi:cephalosporin-C deacetylase-like acetyl esterase
MRSLWLLTILSATALAQPSNKVPEPDARFESLVHQFDYDRKAPLDIREEHREEPDGATVIDLSYVSPRGGRVPTFLVVPVGRGPFAAVLFGHWMMPGSPFCNRKEFLDEALLLVHSGVVSLLIDTPLVRPGFVKEEEGLQAEAQNAEASRQQVIDFRRGVDLLTARSDVDPKRFAYVGHSFNAHVGGILSAVEKRIGSFVLMAGVFSDQEFVFDSNSRELKKFRDRTGEKALRDFFQNYAYDDPVYFVGRSAPASIFLQFAIEDKGIPETFARHYYELFGEPKKIAFYKAGHALNAQARLDRIQWLAQRLSLTPVDATATARIPELK